MKGLKHKLLPKNNYALSGVIEALLLVALVAIILSTIQLVYIPEIMKQKENNHLDEVENQFSNLKSVIETQSLLGVAQSGETISYSPMSSPIDLGTKKLPYFITSNTLGKIEIFDKELCTAKIDLENNPTDYLNGIPLTSIDYEFLTMYISYKPKYILEGGGLIYNQTGGTNDTGEVMKVDPSINVENNSNTIKIYYHIPVLNCPEGKDNLQSIDIAYLRTNYSSYVTHSDTSIGYIRIYTDHLDAWYSSLIENGKGILWEYYNNNYIDVQKKSTYVEITPGTKNIDVEFTIIEMGIQTGQGTVV